jgi:cyclomaltodextrinase
LRAAPAARRCPASHSNRGVHRRKSKASRAAILRGVVDRLDYLQALGVNALYLNPIFASASNHRYHTFDYMQVDPLLGGNAALRELLDAAHARGIKVVLDGVFNHASRGFWAFHHILECGGNSPYLDWFTVRGWPLRPYEHDAERPDQLRRVVEHRRAAQVQHQERRGARNICWTWRATGSTSASTAGAWTCPRRSTMQFLLAGSSASTVKEGNPDAYIVGEIWHEAREWLQGDRFDAVMNYVFSRLALGFFGAETLNTDYRPGGYTLVELDARDLAAGVHHMFSIYSAGSGARRSST